MGTVRISIDLLAPFADMLQENALDLSFGCSPLLKDIIDIIDVMSGGKFKGRLLEKDGSLKEGITILKNGINMDRRNDLMDYKIEDKSKLVFCIAVLGG